MRLLFEKIGTAFIDKFIKFLINKKTKLHHRLTNKQIY